MSEAIELYKQDGSATGVFYCSECRGIFPSQAQAANCHGERMCACGNKIEVRYHSECSTCWGKRCREEEYKRESDRFAKAAKIPASEYDGEMVYLGDKFYTEVEDAVDEYLEGQEPEYVWACKDVGVPLADAESIYENILENMWDDAELSDLHGVDELEAAVSAFNEANKAIHVYQPDYALAILVGKAETSSAPIVPSAASARDSENVSSDNGL